MSKARSLSLQAAGILLLTCGLWAISFPVFRGMTLWAAREIPAIDFLWLAQAVLLVRFSLSALILLFLFRSTATHPTRSEWSQGLGLGLSSGLGMILQQDGLARTSGAVCAFLSVATCVLLVPLAHAALERRLPTPRVLLCVVAVVWGIALISGIDVQHVALGRGEWECLLAGVLFSVQVIWVERPSFEHNRPNAASLIMFAVMALLALPGTLQHPQAGDWSRVVFGSGTVWMMIGVLVVACTLLTFPLMNAWQKHVGATTAGMIYCAEPVLAGLYCTFVPAWLSRGFQIPYSNETLTAHFLMGAGLITAANLALQMRGSGNKT